MDIDNIKTMPGYEEIAALVEQWERLSRRQKELGVKVPLPSYYLNCGEGHDLSAIFEALAGKLEATGLLEFDGKVPAFIHLLRYSDPRDPDFYSFKQLYRTLETEVNRFGNTFRGVLVFDITEWVEMEGTTQPKFADFLSYVEEFAGQSVVFYVDRCTDAGSSKKAFRRIDVSTRVEKLSLRALKPEEALGVLKQCLGGFGFSIEAEAEESLTRTLELVLNTKGAEGLESIREMAEDIVYFILRGEGEVSLKLSKEALSSFLPDGEWTRTFQSKMRPKLGFDLDEE